MHRDIKPENIMLVPDPEGKGEERAKILDFGIAKVAFTGPKTDGQAVQTQHNASLGTPTYMAPEQWQAAATVTDRADVYALGVVLYELLAGQPPFAAGEAQRLMKMHLLDAAPPLHEKDPAIGKELSQLVAKMLAKLPDERPAMAEVAETLERLRDESQKSTPAVMSAAVMATETGRGPPAAPLPVETKTPPPVETKPPPGPATRPNRRSWLPLFILGIATGALFGVGGASVWWRRHTATPKPAPEIVKRAAPWQRVDSPTTENLYAVWGAGPRDIWAVGGEGQVLHFDGATWQQVPLPAKSQQLDSLRAIWGSRSSDVWTVGKAGVVFHYDGTRFIEVPSGTAENLSCIHGLADGTFFVGGRQGVLLRWDGKELLPMDVAPPTKQHVRSVWASAPSDLYAVATSDANDGTILHWDGRSWTQREEPARLNQVWGSGPGDVWVAGGRLGNQGVVLHWDGQKWASVELPGSQWLQSIWGSGSDDVWMAGESNTLFHWNGKQWTRADCNTAESFRGLWGASALDVWAVGTRGVLCHYSGREWQSEPSGSKQNLEGVWRSDGGTTWAVGKGGLILRRAAGETKFTPLASPTSDVALHAVFGFAEDEVFIVGDRGTVLHTDGQTVQPIASGTDVALYAVWAAGKQHVFVGGERGTLLRFDGTSMQKLALPGTAGVRALFGFSPGDVFAAGEGGAIWHITDGNGGIRAVKSGTSATLHGLFGGSAKELWAVGDGGALLRGDASGFAPLPALTPEPIHAIFGSGARDIWATGGGGVTLHYTGGGWTKVLSGSTMALYGLFVDARGEAIAVGQWGTILRY